MKRLFVLLVLFVVAFWATLWLLERRRERGVGAIEDLDRQVEAARITRERLVEAGGSDRGATLNLDEAELRSLILLTVAESEWGDRVLSATREVRVEISNDRVEVGLELSLDEVEADLEGKGGEALERVLDLLRWIPGSDVYVGVRGAPTARRGGVGLLEEDLEVLLGPLSLEARDLEARLGVDAREVTEKARLAVGDLHVASVRAAEERLVLAVRPSG